MAKYELYLEGSVATQQIKIEMGSYLTDEKAINDVERRMKAYYPTYWRGVLYSVGPEGVVGSLPVATFQSKVQVVQTKI